MTQSPSPGKSEYSIGWICALSDERVVASAMLDEHYDPPPQPRSDDNKYTVGRIAAHKIVIACLPAGIYGTTSATRVAEQMRSAFPALRYTLLVGIGGGAPSDDNDIRLGDVVVCQPTDGHGGVIDYTFGKFRSGQGFQLTGFSGKPPWILLNTMRFLQSQLLQGSDLPHHLSTMIQRHGELRGIFEHQGQENDLLYHASYPHVGGADCSRCDPAQLKTRPLRRDNNPVIHYGLIASANIVMKDAIERDRLRQDHGILCFEMEAAGLMHGLDCLVIRGICDYSDSHKNKRWQPYAAATAAAYAKELICAIPVQDSQNDSTPHLRSIDSSVSSPDERFPSRNSTLLADPGLAAVDRQITTYAASDGLPATKMSTSLSSYGILHRPIYMGIYPRNNHFFGRKIILRDIAKGLLPEMEDTLRLRSIALHGITGIGKSQIATEFVYQNMHSFRAVFWISASSKDKLFQGFTEIARELNLSIGTAMNDQEVTVQLVKEWLMKTPEDWLLVFDNANDLCILPPFWPASERGAVLVTSQNPASAYQLANTGIEIKPFSPEESTVFFRGQLEPMTVGDDEARNMTESFGYHTLTIKQMASYIKESQCTLSQFQEVYANSTDRRQLLATPNELSAPGYPHTTMTAFEVTFSKLSPNALSTLGILSFFDPDRIPEALLEDPKKRVPFLASTRRRHTVMRDLGRYSLIEKLDNEPNLRLHRMVVDTISKVIDHDKPKAQEAFQNAAALLHQCFPLQSETRSHMNEKWAECEKYISHVLAFNERYCKLSEQVPLKLSYNFIELLYCSAWYLYERGRLDLSFSLARSAKSAYHEADLRDHRLLLADLYSLQADLYNELTQAEKAEHLAKKSLKIKKAAVKANVLDEHHPQIANSYMDIGVFIAGTNPRKAIGLHQKAIKIREQSPKYADQQAQLLSLNYMNLGRCWWMVKELDKAMIAYEKSLEIIKKLENETRTPYAQTAWTLSGLVNVLIDQEKIDAASDLCEQSMEVHCKVLGPIHHKTAACYNKYAWLLQKKMEHEKAIEYLRLSLNVHIGKQSPSIDTRPEIARTKYQLAEVLHEHGKSEEGDKLKAEAQELRFQLTGKVPEEDDTLESYDELIAYFYR
ncbi:hypothetical protein QQS21_009719 [Conoideocrella luteorostrata]|uniref:Nucleoside phosphorylase domain-containing protein n=1 Tax=Conoideocrella luteorostrata TaxID=1105319 RepID=A0AAJ0FUU2_9HYPO|nr:hypothetical protein QQS21_009719 [Conoideocrella luteorostrata]